MSLTKPHLLRLFHFMINQKNYVVNCYCFVKTFNPIPFLVSNFLHQYHPGGRDHRSFGKCAKYFLWIRDKGQSLPKLSSLDSSLVNPSCWYAVLEVHLQWGMGCIIHLKLSHQSSPVVVQYWVLCHGNLLHVFSLPPLHNCYWRWQPSVTVKTSSLLWLWQECDPTEGSY